MRTEATLNDSWNLAGAAAAVADDGQPENVFALAPRRPSAADHQAGHLAQVADHGKPPGGGIAMMGISFPAVRRTLGVGHVLADQLVRRGPQQQMAGKIAVQERNHVAPGRSGIAMPAAVASLPALIVTVPLT